MDVTPRTVASWIRAGRLRAVGSERRRIVTPAAVAEAFGADVARAMVERAARDGHPVYVPVETLPAS